jgi:hypothetical protein
MILDKQIATGRALVASLAMTLLALPLVAAPAHADPEISVSITRVKALDKVDELSGADIFARVTIDGAAETTKIVKQESFSPDWVVKKTVKPGKHDIRIELIDKDLADDDPIDINKLANRRMLEFSVDTKSCRIEGFTKTFKCGNKIVRAGGENKRAEITFNVKVKK